MLFNSFQFLFFFPIVTILYFLLPHKLRWFHLLVASCVFYMAFVPIYILILFFTIIIDYVAGILIENAAGRRRKLYLSISIIANVGILMFFKYYNFFAGDFNRLFSWFQINAHIPLLDIILPIGLSFHTFQAMSYTIEVYRGNQSAERHLGIYSLYVMFYPQLVAGPIERPQNLLSQFHTKHQFNYDNVVGGLRQMAWGLFKKIVIADRLAIVVDAAYAAPGQNSATSLAIAAVFFAFQIYCDFSGYSDVALGAARVMGFRLMVNFDRPFSAKSITEFWRRWHISLSTWFYDYVYNPIMLALRHWGKAAITFGLVFTFLLSGFWHGAGMKFIVYGIIQGTTVVLEFRTKKQRKKLFSKLPLWLNNGLSRLYTFSHVVVCLVFFRANSIKDALYIIGKFRAIPGELYKVITSGKIAFLQLPGLFNVLLPCVALIVLLELIQVSVLNFIYETSKPPLFTRWFYYCAVTLSILFLGVFENREFIYFKF